MFPRSLQSAFLFVWLCTGWIPTPSVFFFSPCPLAIPIQPYTINKPIKGEEEEESSCFVMFIRQTHGISLWLLASSLQKVIVFNERKQHFRTDLVCSLFHHLTESISYLLLATHTRLSLTLMNHGPSKVCAKIHSLIPLKGVIHAGHIPLDNDGAPGVANLGQLM